MDKKLFFIVTLVCYAAGVTFAQWGMSKKEDCDAVKSRTLIVVVKEPNADLVKKLEASEKDFYISEIENYNMMMKELVPKYWKYSEKVDFKSRSETDKVVKGKSKEYAYMENNKFRVSYASAIALRATKKLKDGEFNLMGGGDYAETAIVVRLTESNPLGNPVYGAYLPSAFPTKSEMVYGIKQLQLQLKYKSEGMKDLGINALYKENAKKLASMTMLLDKAVLSVKEGEIKSIYPYPYELVDKARVEQAFLNEESGFAAFVFIPRAGGSVNTMVVDTKDGVEMARTSNEWSTGVSVSTTELDALKKDITKGNIRYDDLKIIGKQVKK